MDWTFILRISCKVIVPICSNCMNFEIQPLKAFGLTIPCKDMEIEKASISVTKIAFRIKSLYYYVVGMS